MWLPSAPSTKGGPQLRVSSPDPLRSTLMTSAPRSASSCPAHGPARMRASSMTRTPFSGGSAMDHRDCSKAQPLSTPRATVTSVAMGHVRSLFQYAIGPSDKLVHDDVSIHLV